MPNEPGPGDPESAEHPVARGLLTATSAPASGSSSAVARDGERAPSQEFIEKFLLRGFFHGKSHFEDEVFRLLPTSYFPFRRAYWKKERALLAQQYLVFVGPASRVELCICLSSVAGVDAISSGPHGERLIGSGYDGRSSPGSSNSSLWWRGWGVGCCTCQQRPAAGPLSEAKIGEGANGADKFVGKDHPSSGSLLCSPSSGQSPSVAASTPGVHGAGTPPRCLTCEPSMNAVRITVVVRSRRIQLLFRTGIPQQWTEVLQEALAARQDAGSIVQVPLRSLRLWASELSRLRSAEGQGAPRSVASAPLTDAAMRLRRASGCLSFALILGVARGRQLHRATHLWRTRIRALLLRNAAVRQLACCLAAANARATGASWKQWRRRPSKVARPSSIEDVPEDRLQLLPEAQPEALADSLVRVWEPLWAPRAVLVRGALRTTLRGALRNPAAPEKKVALSSNNGYCLAVALRAVSLRCLGQAWRRFACQIARRGLAAALDIAEVRLDGGSRVYEETLTQAFYIHGARRMAASLRRVLAWRLGEALLLLAGGHAARASSSAGSSPNGSPEANSWQFLGRLATAKASPVGCCAGGGGLSVV